jgi:hypothetical protein
LTSFILVATIQNKNYLFTEENPLSKDATKKLFDYITLLESVNEELVNTLEMTTKLLEQFKPLVSDQKVWQDMLDRINYTISLERKVNKSKILH